ncbi:glycosyltransferase family 31 protein [Cucurbitaria berberidis CBS 394.84]|uniref:N-acetylgalactosaminide beta-1,3-galactosyltransferase n=1 Tax=Cucurbitaria berberidis CBS 394.84 TaxID=1168544 RepID=A0A9P4GJB6_9PLEO|nr:glycosyltransferase family 31 protein [Cucurbitaria berberidis CBS 394.84]KAF1846451.1 glycosyltransferase family 31 protein [Cucurbitaria berberidis CBS 394.84]
MLAPRNYLPRPLRFVLVLALIYAFCWVKGWPRYYDDEELPASQRPYSQTSAGPHTVCHDQLVVSVLTTAADAYAKVSPLLAFTNEEDRDPLLLFSDLYTEIGVWPVFDVLWRFPQNFIRETAELGRYRAQVDYSRRSIPIAKLRKQDPVEEERILATLYKYKILQTMAAAWEYRPDRSWYAFVDDETYINRANMLDWLSQYDSKSKHFFGNPPTPSVPNAFAAGGTSFVLSHEVMKELFKARNDTIKSWQSKIVDHTSALDLVLNVLQTDLKLDIEASWPGISGFDPSTIPFSPALWCVPVLMMHHVPPEIGSNLWKLENDRTKDHLMYSPIRFADLWTRFMTPENLNDTRNDWDNLSSESSNSRWNILFEGPEHDNSRAKSGEESPEACEEACRTSTYCMQWSYSSIPQKNWNENPQTKCHLSSSVRFGAHTESQERNFNGEKTVLSWKSGWRKSKFTAWANQQRCKAQHQ